jgi:ribonuclease D
MMRNDFPFKPTITKEEIAELPVQKFEGEIFYIDTIENFEIHIGDLKNERVLGFDTETKPTFKKGALNKVSLLQLSTSAKAYLFRLNKIGLPKALASILANNSIIKVGVAIHDDIVSLRKLKEFKPNGFIDLQQFVKDYGILDNGLKKLTANILDFKISKRQQTSNWEAEELNQAQIEYAATDAWVCCEIYKTLMQ